MSDELVRRLRVYTDSDGSYPEITDEAADEIDKLHSDNAKLREGLADLFAMMDEGLLVRNISRDHEDGFTIRALAFVQRLQRAKSLLDQDGGK